MEYYYLFIYQYNTNKYCYMSSVTPQTWFQGQQGRDCCSEIVGEWFGRTCEQVVIMQ